MGACVAFDAAANHLLTGTWDGRLLVWGLASGEPRLLGERREHSTHVTRIAVSPAGKVIATVGEDQTLNLWEPGTYRRLARVRAHTNSIYGLAMSPDGQTVLTGSSLDSVTRVWRTERGDAGDQPTVGSLIASFTADSRALVLGPRNADCRCQLVGATPTNFAVATNLALPGDLLNKPFDVFGDKPIGALGRSGGRLELWDLAAGNLITSWQAATNQICVVAFSPDGRLVATGNETGEVKIWDVASRTEEGAVHPAGERVTSLAFSRDGRRLAGAVGWFRPTVLLWDVASRRPLPFPRDHYGIIGLEFSPDDHLIAAAGMDGSVELWDAFSGEQVAKLKGHVMGGLACLLLSGRADLGDRQHGWAGETLEPGHLSGTPDALGPDGHRPALALRSSGRAHVGGRLHGPARSLRPLLLGPLAGGNRRARRCRPGCAVSRGERNLGRSFRVTLARDLLWKGVEGDPPDAGR